MALGLSMRFPRTRRPVHSTLHDTRARSGEIEPEAPCGAQRDMDTTPNLVTIFGGAGFIGTQLVQLLAKQGYRIRVALVN